MKQTMFRREHSIFFILVVLLGLSLAGCGSTTSPTVIQLVPPSSANQQNTPLVSSTPTHPSYLKGKTPSLSWILGHDCQQGMQAYSRSAATNPDVALVGTGWINPTDGSLIAGNNTCTDGSRSMDNVIDLAHSKGGMAYLTVTMDTEDAGAWTYQQAADYIERATTNPHLLDPIVQEVTRANYDGVILDLEGVDSTHPLIQQRFATYNQLLHAALQSLHKWYGIALIHKVSEHDDTDRLNAFENWHLLATTADFLVIMALDHSIFTPGPGVSLDWLKQMVAYALQTMPDMLPRVIWELPLYGASWYWHAGVWVSDGPVTYQQAQAIVQQVPTTAWDANASDVNDDLNPHLVYTDASGVKRSVWYLTPKSLYSLLVRFQQTLTQQPQFAHGILQTAFWWRTTQEPQEFWSMLDTLYQ